MLANATAYHDSNNKLSLDKARKLVSKQMRDTTCCASARDTRESSTSLDLKSGGTVPTMSVTLSSTCSFTSAFSGSVTVVLENCKRSTSAGKAVHCQTAGRNMLILASYSCNSNASVSTCWVVVYSKPGLRSGSLLNSQVSRPLPHSRSAFSPATLWSSPITCVHLSC